MEYLEDEGSVSCSDSGIVIISRQKFLSFIILSLVKGGVISTDSSFQWHRRYSTTPFKHWMSENFLIFHAKIERQETQNKKKYPIFKKEFDYLTKK